MKYRLLSILLLIGHFTYPQEYYGHPCTTGYAALKILLQKKEIELEISECDLDANRATSFLKAEGKAPPKVDPKFEDGDGDRVYDTWTCMYAAGRAIDGDPTTAWVEGMPGSGKGELLLIINLDLINLDLSRKIEILAGLGKSSALFMANNRPKTINVHVVRATLQPVNATQCITYSYGSIIIIASMNLTLRDVNQFQPLPIPAFKREKYKRDGGERDGGEWVWDYTYWLMLELIDVYPGTKYQDTCISEIRNMN